MITLYGTQGSGSAADRGGARDRRPAVPPRRGGVVEARLARPRRAEARSTRSPRSRPSSSTTARVLSESAAILIELGLRHPQSGLLATRCRRRARSRSAASSTSPPTAMPASASSTTPTAGIPSPTTAVKEAMQERGRARLHELWELFADQFPADPWLSGARIGALDVLAATVSKWSGARKALAASRPGFARCWRGSRPSRASRRSGRAIGRRADAGDAAAPAPAPARRPRPRRRRLRLRRRRRRKPPAAPMPPSSPPSSMPTAASRASARASGCRWPGRSRPRPRSRRRPSPRPATCDAACRRPATRRRRRR